MQTLDLDTQRSLRGRPQRRSAFVFVLAAFASLALMVVGCGSGSGGRGVAQVPTTSTQSSQDDGSRKDSGSTKGDPAAYSACMRSHGVPKFPDPDSEGHFFLKAGPGTGIEPESAQFKAADRACRKLAPKETAPSPAQQAKDREKLLKFAACMRSHGLPKFPDPDPSGGISIGRNSGVDPNSPQFKAAEKACQNLLPGPKGRSTNSPGGTP
jgi:hypothetical protein